MGRPAVTDGMTHRDPHAGLGPALLAGAAVLTLAGLLLLLAAAPAGAHAALVDATPGPGVELAAPPGVVELRFSEPLIADLSSATVVDPDGQRWTAAVADGTEMRVRLETTARGLYRVEWKTVSPLDGHTLRGSFAFGVGVDPGEVEEFAPVPSPGDRVLIAPRAVEYVALLVTVGMLLVRRLAAVDPAVSLARRDVRGPLAVALAAGAVVVAGEGVLAAGDVIAIDSFLRTGPGVVRLARLGLVAVALAAAALRLRWLIAVALAGGLVALSAAGHAAAAEPTWWGVGVNSAHLIAAGLWAGAIGGFVTLRPPGGWRGDETRELLRRFTPVAITAFVATVAFGTLRGAQELTGLGDLVRSDYGQVLTLKVLSVAAMVPLSWRAWRRREARPLAESVLAVGVVALAAVLAAFPLPPRRAADTALPPVAEDEALPREGDITLGDDTGDVLVGLTLRPGEAGRNEVLVHLLPTGGPQEAEHLDAWLTVGGEEAGLEICGATCRQAAVRVRGGEDVAVTVAGVDDEPATFTLPDELPPPDGRDLLGRVDEHMNTLDTYRYEEVLGPAEPPIRSEWAIQAPDRLHGVVYDRDTGEIARETVRIADRTWNRRPPDEDWSVSDSPALAVPAHIWDYPDRVAVGIVATEVVDGEQMDVLSFFIDHTIGPIWYRLWVNDDDLVHRAEMRARGHFMDHDYGDFDAPFAIEPPGR